MGGFPTNLPPPLGFAGCWNTFGKGTPSGLPPGNPPPPPPGFPFPPPPGNPCPWNGWSGLRWSGCVSQNAATPSSVYICPVLGSIAPTQIVCIVVVVWLIVKSSICSAAASLVMSFVVGDSQIWIMLGWLLAFDGVFALDGVVSSCMLSALYVVCCDARWQSTSSEVMLRPKSSPVIQYASQCPLASKFSTQQTSAQQTCEMLNLTG